MKKEWVVLALLTVGVAALELLGSRKGASAGSDPPEAAVPTEQAPPPNRSVTADSAQRGPYRTVQLHVTGMT